MAGSGAYGSGRHSRRNASFVSAPSRCPACSAVRTSTTLVSPMLVWSTWDSGGGGEWGAAVNVWGAVLSRRVSEERVAAHRGAEGILRFCPVAHAP